MFVRNACQVRRRTWGRCARIMPRRAREELDTNDPAPYDEPLAADFARSKRRDRRQSSLTSNGALDGGLYKPPSAVWPRKRPCRRVRRFMPEASPPYRRFATPRPPEPRQARQGGLPEPHTLRNARTQPLAAQTTTRTTTPCCDRIPPFRALLWHGSVRSSKRALTDTPPTPAGSTAPCGHIPR